MVVAWLPIATGDPLTHFHKISFLNILISMMDMTEDKKVSRFLLEILLTDGYMLISL
jgi:hypothetical protein